MEADERAPFVEHVASEREERELLKAQTKNLVLLQAMGRGLLTRRNFVDSVKCAFSVYLFLVQGKLLIFFKCKKFLLGFLKSGF